MIGLSLGLIGGLQQSEIAARREATESLPFASPKALLAKVKGV